MNIMNSKDLIYIYIYNWLSATIDVICRDGII